MAKVVLGLVTAVLVTVVAAKLASTASSDAGSEPVNPPWSQDKMEFVAWNGARWTAWIRDGVFELVPETEGRWSRHSNGSIAFIDWEGEPWQAKVEGDMFLLAHRGDWNGPTESATAIRYRDGTGKKQLRTVDQLRR